jgi:Multicopper oxidase
VERGKTYRLRILNTGSFAAIRFSVDNHPLTLIEADGTLLAPTQVSGVTVEVAQRHSVLLYANQTSSPNGTYWMRATLQTDMFTYNQPGQNVDIRGVIRYVLFVLDPTLSEKRQYVSSLGIQTAQTLGSLETLPLQTPARACPAFLGQMARPTLYRFSLASRRTRRVPCP